MKKKYHVIPTIHSKTQKKGWYIGFKEAGCYWPRLERDGTYIVYHDLRKAEEDCQHLNGNSRVVGYVDVNSIAILRMLWALVK